VIGAGIVGVTTAYELAADGHAVTVFERRNTVAAETSFANAGVIAPGYVTPWAAPGMPWKVMSQVFGRHAAVRFAGLPSLAQCRWMWRWWRACRPAVYRRNRSAMQTLAQYSRQRLSGLAQGLRLDFEQAQGYLVLLRSDRALAGAQAGLKLLQELGVNMPWSRPIAVARWSPGSTLRPNWPAPSTCRTTAWATAGNLRTCSGPRHSDWARSSASITMCRRCCRATHRGCSGGCATARARLRSTPWWCAQVYRPTPCCKAAG